MSITYADIRKFIFHMKDAENKKASTINVYTAAIRFFFEYTLGYLWDPKKIPKMKRDRKLPVILTREQVNLLIDSIDNYKHKAITATMYSSGLRVSEVCHLRLSKNRANISKCEKCGHAQYHNNSCRDRSCPMCQALSNEMWVDEQNEHVLDIDYYHLVFTCPSELNPLIYCNQKELYSLFFHAAAQTILELSEDPAQVRKR